MEPGSHEALFIVTVLPFETAATDTALPLVERVATKDLELRALLERAIFVSLGGGGGGRLEGGLSGSAREFAGRRLESIRWRSNRLRSGSISKQRLGHCAGRCPR